MPVTVSIVEDHRDTRERLAELLSDEANVRYANSYASAEEALQQLPAAPPDVVLADIRLRHIYEKLHVQCRTEATLKYLEHDSDN